MFWFDCETSGLDPARHGIISLAFEVEVEGVVVEKGMLFSNCEGKEVEDQALAVNLYTREQISAFPPPSEMHRRLLGVFGRYVDKYNPADKFYAGGYNAEFDLRFLRQLWTDLGDQYFGSWFYFRAIDPSTIIPLLRYAGRLPRFPAKATLLDTARYFHVDEPGAHDAYVDCRMARAVTWKILSAGRELVEAVRGLIAIQDEAAKGHRDLGIANEWGDQIERVRGLLPEEHPQAPEGGDDGFDPMWDGVSDAGPR